MCRNASPPSASINTMSRTTLPGSCSVHDRQPPTAWDNASVNPSLSAVWAASASPARPVMPRPSAVTVNGACALLRLLLRFTFKVALLSRGCGLRPPAFSQLRRAFLWNQNHPTALR